MVFCGKCGEENPEESSFCWKCGAELIKRTPQSSQITHSECIPPAEKGSATESYRGVERKVDGDAVVLTERASKEECDKYRIPTILCGVILCLFIIIALCTMKYSYIVYPHGSDLSIGNEKITLLEMATKGWSTVITVMFIVAIACAIGSLFYYGLSSISIFALLISNKFSNDIVEVGSGSLCYDYHLDILDMGVLGIPALKIAIIGILIVIIGEYCFYKFRRQFGKNVPLTRALKELWKFN